MMDLARAYIDDVVVYSESWEEHLRHLQTVLEHDGLGKAYIDDVVVYSESWEEHLRHLQTVLEHDGLGKGIHR